MSANLRFHKMFHSQRQAFQLMKGLLLFVGLLFSQFLFANPIEEGKHCVAYRAKKRLFLLKEIRVVGTNCEVASQIIPEVGQVFYVEVFVPSDRFFSDEPERDRDVRKILKKASGDSLVFRSRTFSKEEWRAKIRMGSFQVPGEIRLKERKVPVEASLLVKGEGSSLSVEGKINSHFSTLGVSRPKMALGVLALVRDELEFYFRLNGSKTLGLGNILERNFEEIGATDGN